MATVVTREGAEVCCTGPRYWLRVRRTPQGGARIEGTDAVDATWAPVDDSVVTLTRATTRLVCLDVAAAHRIAHEAASLLGVAPRDPSPITALVRTAYPLLWGATTLPLPEVPPELPEHLRPAFRHRSPREATVGLYGRATRPLIRATCELLAGPVDLLTLTVAVASSGVLEPDQIVRVLRGARPRPGGAGLGAEECGALHAALDGVSPSGVVAALTSGLATPADRDRLRFVAAEHRPGMPTFRDAGDWHRLALAIATGGPA